MPLQYDPIADAQRTATWERIAADFAAQGVVILPEFVPQAYLDAAHRALAEHYGDLMHAPPAIDPNVAQRGSVWDEYKTDVLPWISRDEPFLKIAALPELDAATTACIGAGYSVNDAMAMLTPPGGLGQAWHQDCPPRDATQYNLNRLLYTTDVQPEDGAIVFVPGSHRAGLISEGDAQESLPDERLLAPKAGTLVLLHGHVYHRVTPSRSGKSRLSVNFRAYPAGVSSQVCHIGIYRNAAFDFLHRQPLTREQAMQVS